MKDGVEQYHIVYPKFMNGEAVVRNVPVKQNFGRLNNLNISVMQICVLNSFSYPNKAKHIKCRIYFYTMHLCLCHCNRLRRRNLPNNGRINWNRKD